MKNNEVISRPDSRSSPECTFDELATERLEIRTNWLWAKNKLNQNLENMRFPSV